MTATLAWVALLVATFANAAPAASFDVAIAKLDPTATTCGLSAADLERVARRTLENSQVPAKADAGGTLRVRVTAGGVRKTTCAARLSIQMKAVANALPADGMANAQLRSRRPVVLLCDKGGNYQATKAVFPLAVESGLERSVRQCLGSLKY